MPDPSEALNGYKRKKKKFASDAGEIARTKSSKGLIRTLPKTIVARMRASLRNFSLRPYFSRLWVAQEVSLAESRSVHCGPSCLSWREMSNFHHDMLSPQRESKDHDLWPSVFFELLLDRPGMDCDESLVMRVIHWRPFHCSDVRDRVYGVLSLSQPRDQESTIKPNYLISSFNLLLDIALVHARATYHPE